MVRQAVIVRFPGDPKILGPRYAEGLRRFRAADPDTRPDAMFFGQSAQAPDALVVVILWPEGVDHHLLGQFMLDRLGDLGLERPTAVDHIAVSGMGFEGIAAMGTPASGG